jgi:catechol 2,3-dioxygenase-like lactoylglutathione lyase family enzyme
VARLVGINHVAVQVADLDGALAFFQRIFDGVTLRGRTSGMAFVDLGDQFIALEGVAHPVSAGHYGLVVDDRDVALIEDIPTGTVCTVTELANGPFSTVVVPADGTVTIDTDGEDVEFTNTRLFGRITVTKNIVGAPNGAATSFTC